MAAVLQLEPRFADPAPTPGNPIPGNPVRRLRVVDPGVVCPDRRQPRPQSARSHQRAVYRRRRVLAALVGLGLVLAMVRVGVTLGGSSLATPERLPHVQQIVVQPGDSLWSIANRAAPGHDVRPIVAHLVQSLGTSTVTAGESISVHTP
jgi:hypothetical protein